MSTKRIPPNKIYWLDVAYEVRGEKSYIVHAHAVRADLGREWVKDGEDVLHGVFDEFNARGACVVYVWDMGFFGMFCDYYALKNGLPQFKEAEKRKGASRGAGEPCYSCLYAGGRGVLNFRLTTRRTRKTHDYGSGKIGGLHTVEYRGLSDFFNGERYETICPAFGVAPDDPKGGAKMLTSFFERFSDVVGEDCLLPSYMREVYTIGGAARRAYLRMRYGKDSLPAYQREHNQDEAVEDYFRSRKLLLAGMCFFPNGTQGKLIEKPLTKYDVNGLYSYTANNVGELGFPRECTFTEFERERESGDEYIVSLKRFVLVRRPNMPAVFCNPFRRSESEYIEIDQPFSMFRPLYDELKKFYMFEEIDVSRCFRLKKRHDPAMIAYNEYFQKRKSEADKNGDKVSRMIAKSFLNNLIGKFSQATKYVPQVAEYDEKADEVKFTSGDLVDNWERGHFDYIRGAYIYTMARVKMMRDIRRLCSVGGNAKDHHFYTDTDSIVTDLTFPAEEVDPFRLGKYKEEEEYTAFGAIAKKVYYGRSKGGIDLLTAAGIPKGIVLREIYESYGGDLGPQEVFKILCSPVEYSIPRNIRCRGGGCRVDMGIKLCEINIDKYL